MKKLFIAIAIICCATVSAQEKEDKELKKSAVPQVVKDEFNKEFPGKKAKWENENGGYEAGFKINGTDASAIYDKKGHRKELEIDMKVSELPQNVIAYVKKNYPSNKIKEAAKITDDKNVINYEAEITKDAKSYDLLFDADGKFIKIALGD